MRILIIILLMCLTGCRSTKTTTKAREEMDRNTQLNAVAVKGGTRETNTVRYWPDGSVYQLQNVKEQMDGAELVKVRIEEKHEVKASEVMKESEPLKIWVYAGIGLVLMIGIYRIIK